MYPSFLHEANVLLIVVRTGFEPVYCGDLIDSFMLFRAPPQPIGLPGYLLVFPSGQPPYCNFEVFHSSVSKQDFVRMTGIEPAHLAALDPKSSVSTSSTTSACYDSVKDTPQIHLLLGIKEDHVVRRRRIIHPN